MDESVCVPHLNISIEENEFKKGAIEILRIIRPTWILENIQFKVLTDGITNKLIRCRLVKAPVHETVLVRIYGNNTDLLIDRKAEKRNILTLNKAGLPPRLYASFDNGLAYEYIPGKTLTTKLIKQPEIYVLIATHLAHMHQIKVHDMPNKPILWEKLQNFFNLLPERFSDSKTQKSFEENFPPHHKIQEEINMLKKNLSKLNSPIVFTHNDLLLNNVIYCTEKKTVAFIDYEYSALNYQAYDIGNHFAEFVGLENVDYLNFPEKELQWNWLRAYLTALRKDEDVSDRDIHKLYVQVNKFVLVSHVFWAIWALLQAEYSSIDFNFVEYAAIRMNEYFAKKDAFLSLSLPR